ncbi:MAG: FIST N-terminal domain-containing protein [Candidatus Thermoplasmatota archaeon]
MDDSDFEVSVGMSRKWDAREAGREVARNTIRKLKRPPDFFLLFSTIHYENNGGFKEFLNGVWDVLPEGIPLVGGTVAGFMNPDGCYTRGASALAVSYPYMDVAIGVGKGTKKTPKRAARKCANNINKELSASIYKNKFLFNIMAGARVPKLPFIGKRKAIKSNLLGKIMVIGFRMSNDLFGFGMGKEEFLIEELSKQLKNYHILGLSSTDNNQIMDYFQFHNKNVVHESVLGVGISTNLSVDILTTHGHIPFTNPLKIKFNPFFKTAVNKINGKPATEKIIEITNWSKKYLDEEIHRRSFYYPVLYVKDDEKTPATMGAFFGQNVILTHLVRDCDEIQLAYAFGRNLLDSAEKNIESYSDIKNDIKLPLIVSCGIRLNALGNKVYVIHKMLSKFFRNKPFLVLYGSGENSYKPGGSPKHINESFNTAVLGA